MDFPFGLFSFWLSLWAHRRRNKTGIVIRDAIPIEQIIAHYFRPLAFGAEKSEFFHPHHFLITCGRYWSGRVCADTKWQRMTAARARAFNGSAEEQN